VVYARDKDRVFAVHPFRFRVRHDRIKIDWEHTEFAWVSPDALRHRPTVPKLDKVWAEVKPHGQGRTEALMGK
jgi:hypothetical protein